MIVALVNQKGGVGKSTLTVALAAELYARGAGVLVADADPQRSVQGWAALAAEAGRAAPTVVGVQNGFHRAEQLPKLSRSVDWTIVDCPPHCGSTTRAALTIAHLALLPCGPGAFDAWALGETLELVAEARRLRPELRAAVVLNRVARHTRLGAGAREVLGNCGVGVLDAGLGQRVAFGEAIAAGQGPAQYAPRSRAAQEVRAVVDELVLMLAGKRKRGRKEVAA